MRVNTELSVGIFVIVAICIFFYMTFKIGVFRVDTGSYREHTVYFKDLSGLSRKADVKIAGVKVGWVSDVSLVDGDENYKAQADILVYKKYQLHSDAYAVVRQDGLLGVKYLEVAPGDPLLPSLKDGQALGKPGKSPTSIDELLQQFKSIGSHVEEITVSVKNALRSVDGKEQLQETFTNIHRAAERIASFTEVVDRIVGRNENDINAIIHDVRDFAHELRESMPYLAADIRKVAHTLNVDTLPSFQKNFERIANVFDRDFDKIAIKLENTAGAIEEAALQTRDGFRSIGSVADKINEGKGLLGKLVNEDETYHDIKVAVQGLKNYFSKVEGMGVVFDAHSETMYNPAENFELADSKGYFDVRLYPNNDHFYQMQAVGSMKGSVERVITRTSWYDSQGNVVSPEGLNIDDNYRLMYMPKTEQIIQKRDSIKYGFQFGKIFKDIAFRFGMFENSVGIAVDYDIPLDMRSMRWVTSFEMFDMRGRDRLDDSRPHLKWINKLFFLRNFYFNFGADDFMSKRNANTFCGLGIRFADDDIKYFFSRLGVGGSQK